jgi:hypothetical protein
MRNLRPIMKLKNLLTKEKNVKVYVKILVAGI